MGKSSISLVVEFIIIYDGKEQKKTKRIKETTCLQKIQKHYLSSDQKLASTQTLGSAFLDRVRKVQNSKNESNFFKIIDCFIVGYDSVNSERVNFSITF